jgi:3-deoxy-7-phosphoheptulonate synthase
MDRLLRWWQLPAAQQPAWPDRAALGEAVTELRRRPALVAARECDRLRARLAAMALGEAFLLQAGECAETFAGVRAGSVQYRGAVT